MSTHDEGWEARSQRLERELGIAGQRARSLMSAYTADTELLEACREALKVIEQDPAHVWPTVPGLVALLDERLGYTEDD